MYWDEIDCSVLCSSGAVSSLCCFVRLMLVLSTMRCLGSRSIERMMEYTRLPSETARVCEGAPAPSPRGPGSGGLKFEGVTARYRPGLQPVLHNLSFSVPVRKHTLTFTHLFLHALVFACTGHCAQCHCVVSFILHALGLADNSCWKPLI